MGNFLKQTMMFFLLIVSLSCSQNKYYIKKELGTRIEEKRMSFLKNRVGIVSTANNKICHGFYLGGGRFVSAAHCFISGGKNKRKLSEYFIYFHEEQKVRAINSVDSKMLSSRLYHKDYIILNIDSPIDNERILEVAEEASEIYYYYLNGDELELIRGDIITTEKKEVEKSLPYFFYKIYSKKGVSGSMMFNERGELVGIHLRNYLVLKLGAKLRDILIKEGFRGGKVL